MFWVMCHLVLNKDTIQYRYIRIEQEKGSKLWQRSGGPLPLEADSGLWRWSMEDDGDEMIPLIGLWTKKRAF